MQDPASRSKSESTGARSICLLSGGLDSTVALALAREQGPVALALTADYGQRAARREIEWAGRIAAHFGVPHRVVELPFFRTLPAGALVDAKQELPRPDRATLDRAELGLDVAPVAASADRVWVPNRNGVLIEVAAAFAEALGAARVVVGFNREEAVTFPDNSRPYLESMNAALRFSTRGKVALDSPTAEMDKVEILRAGAARNVPFSFVWPCYEGGTDPCGTCESCQRLRRASERSGVSIGRRPF